jgi:MFS family permease
MKELVTSEIENGSDDILEEGSEKSTPEKSEEMNDRAPTSTDSQKNESLRKSLRNIFSLRNYSVYLVTSWVYSGFAVIYSYFTLYLWEIKWEFILIGAVMTAVAGFSALSRFVGGYVGDVVNRKYLSVIAMFLMATYHLILGLFSDFVFILGALAIFSSFGIFQGGSSAYIMDNIPKKNSGLALSLFRMGSSLGIITLIAFGAIIQIMEFAPGFRLIYLISGFFLVVCAIGRAALLESSPMAGRNKEKSLWHDFLSENFGAVRLIMASMPVILAIVVLDSVSDSIFNFGALIYTSEFLSVDIGGINVMLLTPLVISVPLLFKIGRMSDYAGMKKPALLVYSIMPLCALLMIAAPVYEFWMPSSVVSLADATLPGLGIVFTTPFLALVLKYTNDSLWLLVLWAMIQKSMPTRDTSKVLAVFWSAVHLISSIGPFIGGIIFQYSNPLFLFALVLVVNLMILFSISIFGVEKKEAEGLSSKIQSVESRIGEIRKEFEEFRAGKGRPS